MSVASSIPKIRKPYKRYGSPETTPNHLYIWEPHGCTKLT